MKFARGREVLCAEIGADLEVCAQFLGGQKFRNLICLSTLSSVASGNSNISGISLFRMALFDLIDSPFVFWFIINRAIVLMTWGPGCSKLGKECHLICTSFFYWAGRSLFGTCCSNCTILVFNVTHSEISQGLPLPLQNCITQQQLMHCGHPFTPLKSSQTVECKKSNRSL